MKRLLALMLAAALALSLMACGGGDNTGDNSTPSTGNGDMTSTDTSGGGEDNTSNNTSTPIENESGQCKTGDTVETELYRLTLKQAEFIDSILVYDEEKEGEDFTKDNFANSENFFTPYEGSFVDEDGYVIDGLHGFGVRDDADYSWLYYNFEFEYIGKEERDSTFVILEFAPKVFYKDYTFDSDYMAFGRIIDEIRFNKRMWFNFNSDDYSYVKALGLEIGGFGDLKPLSSDVYEVRGMIRVPNAAVEDTNAEFVLKLAGIEFSV